MRLEQITYHDADLELNYHREPCYSCTVIDEEIWRFPDNIPLCKLCYQTCKTIEQLVSELHKATIN